MPGGAPLCHPLVGCFHWNLLGWTLGGCWTGATGKFSGAGGGAFPGDVAGSETGFIHVIANWSFFFLPPFCFFSGMAVAMPRVKAGRARAQHAIERVSSVNKKKRKFCFLNLNLQRISSEARFGRISNWSNYLVELMTFLAFMHALSVEVW